MRGLDYYNLTVFEWVTNSLGAQGTVCAGGRYDGLVEQLGGQPTPAVGFAMGMERLVLMLETLELNGDILLAVDVYLAMVGEGTEQAGFQLAERLRDALPDLRLMSHCGGGNFKKQLKRADKSGAAIALILARPRCKTGDHHQISAWPGRATDRHGRRRHCPAGSQRRVSCGSLYHRRTTG